MEINANDKRIWEALQDAVREVNNAHEAGPAGEVSTAEKAADKRLRELVNEARDMAWTWADIGEALGVNPADAYQRYGLPDLDKVYVPGDDLEWVRDPRGNSPVRFDRWKQSPPPRRIPPGGP